MYEQQYLDILSDIMKNGHDRDTRSGPVRTVFVRTMRFDLRDSFPLLTTKKMATRALIGELFGHIKGAQSAAEYRALGSRVWDANANENEGWLKNPNRRGKDDLGRIYGSQWRRWQTADGEEIDQLAKAINLIKTDPHSRYQIVTAWNPGELNKMALPPCPYIFHFFVQDDFLSMHLLQRSCDMFLGVPFNIAQYALLLHIVAQVTNKQAFELVHTLEDAHIYHNHFGAVEEQLSRKPLAPPVLHLSSDITEIDDFAPSDITFTGYESHPAIRAEMAV